MKNKPLCAIIVHEMNAVVAKYLERSIESCFDQTHKADLIVVTTKDAAEKMEKIEVFKSLQARFEKERDTNDESLVYERVIADDWKPKPGFLPETDDYSSTQQAMMNLAVEYSLENGYEYLNILEYDDFLHTKYCEYCIEYMKHKKADICLPMALMFGPGKTGYDDPYKNVVAIANDAGWAPGIYHEQGWVDIDGLLKGHPVYNLIVSALYNTKIFANNEPGYPGFKPALKWKFDFEFLLRAVYQGAKVFVVPRNLYGHMVNRKDSLTESLSGSMNKEEATFWEAQARKQFFFSKHRPIQYEEKHERSEETKEA